MKQRKVGATVYSKILVPLDGSDLAERALPLAQLVAGAMSIPMELAEAFDVLPPAVHNRSSRMALDLMLAEQQRRSQRYLSEVRERLQPTEYPLTTVTLPGWPDQAIAEWARQDPDALVVMTTHGRGGLARWALGSVADRVLHTVPNAVLIVRANDTEAVPAGFRTVLVPVDGSNLAEMALEHAVSLAMALEAKVALIRTTHTARHYRSRIAGSAVASGYSPDRFVNELMRDDADEVSNYLTQVQNRLVAEHGENSRADILHLRHDSPAQAIIEHAETQPTLIVMTSHGRGGVGRLILGSVADRVVRHSNAPVLVIRPRA